MAKSVFVVLKKIREGTVKNQVSEYLINTALDVVRWLVEEKYVNVIVEKWLYETITSRGSILDKARDRIVPFIGNEVDWLVATVLKSLTDVVICIGGDGTLLHYNYLFQDKPAPVVLPFHGGSLGFLTTLSLEEIRPRVTAALQGKFKVTMRSRLKCTLISVESLTKAPRALLLAKKLVDKASSFDEKDAEKGKQLENLELQSTIIPSKKELTYTILNDVVISRGQSPAMMINLEVLVNNQFLTFIHADGVLIATPTGSTAYSMTSGGSMVHPSSKVILLTPIANSSSFRPLILPEDVEICIRTSLSASAVPDTAVGHITFDGRSRLPIRPGDVLRVTKAEYSLATANASETPDGAVNVADWATSLAHCLHWNDPGNVSVFKQKKEHQPSEINFSI